MKQMIEYDRVSGYLDTLYRKLNEKYFNGELPKVVITIQDTPRAYGHITINKVWHCGADTRREINIGAGTLNRPIENVVSTLLHEMAHLYNLEHNIKDCSRGGTYHNKKFKETAEKCDLLIEHDPLYGWTITSPTDKLIEYCIEEGLQDIKIVRGAFVPLDTDGTPKTIIGTPPDTPTPKKPSSTRKYQCPHCKNSCRATKNINIICGDCKIPYELVSD